VEIGRDAAHRPNRVAVAVEVNERVARGRVAEMQRVDLFAVVRAERAQLRTRRRRSAEIDGCRIQQRTKRQRHDEHERDVQGDRAREDREQAPKRAVRRTMHVSLRSRDAPIGGKSRAFPAISVHAPG